MRTSIGGKCDAANLVDVLRMFTVGKYGPRAFNILGRSPGGSVISADQPRKSIRGVGARGSLLLMINGGFRIATTNSTLTRIWYVRVCDTPPILAPRRRGAPV